MAGKAYLALPYIFPPDYNVILETPYGKAYCLLAKSKLTVLSVEGSAADG
jgi:hypothetical protein